MTLVHLPIDRTADRVRDAPAETMATLPAHLKRSLTWDQGSETGRHHEFAVAAELNARPRKRLDRDTRRALSLCNLRLTRWDAMPAAGL
ncbi:hypothetical protein ACIBIZ_12555 [Nonomuraea spiralis]|uniref:hypothetical protein n=1 Tax=Nonomuraea TaxID=83681 RepID=UPI00163C8FE9